MELDEVQVNGETLKRAQVFLCIMLLIAGGCSVSKKQSSKLLYSAMPTSLYVEAVSQSAPRCCISVQGVTSKSFRIIDLESGSVTQIAVPNDTKRVVGFSGSDEHVFTTGLGWYAAHNISTGKEDWRRTLSRQDAVLLTCSSNGSVAAYSAGNALLLVSSEKEVELLRSDRLYDAIVNPEGSHIAAILQDAVILFDVRTLRRVGDVRKLVSVRKGIHVYWLLDGRIAIQDEHGIHIFAFEGKSLKKETSIANAEIINRQGSACLHVDYASRQLRTGGRNLGLDGLLFGQALGATVAKLRGPLIVRYLARSWWKPG